MKEGLHLISSGIQKLSSWFAHFVDRLTSRKFLLTVAACLAFAANGEWGLISATVAAFITAEGAGDVVQRYNESKAQTTSPSVQDLQTLLNEDDDDIDTSKIVSGDFPM